MPKVREILDALEQIAPRRFAFSFDKVGLQVGDPDREVQRAIVSLDRSLAAVRYAQESKAQLLLAHHPLIFRPIESVDSRSHVGKTILVLARADIAFVAAHTNWDSAVGGINDTLAYLVGLQNVKAFGSAAEVKRYKLVTFCPEDSLDRLVDALSEAGAGVIGAYARCGFASTGSGFFTPLEGANPTIGTVGAREEVSEIRLEMVLPAASAGAAVRALRSAHPYEEPAYDLYPLKEEREQPAGRIGSISKVTLPELVRLVEGRLSTKAWAWGNPEKLISKVAVVGGSADDEWMNAQRAGADVLITGEVKQHVALEASESGMCLIGAGHYATEHPGCETLRRRMSEAFPAVDWQLFTPEAGMAGRPL